MSGKGNISNQSTENAFAILEHVISSGSPLKLSEIAKNLNMNASTVSRYITALQSCGYVVQDAKTLRYSPTIKICELANTFMSHFKIADLAHPFVQEISDYFGETSCFSIEQNFHVFYIDIVVSSSRTLMNVQRVGNSAPLHSTAAGKLFLTNYTLPQLKSLIEKHPLEKYTETTIVSFDALVDELDKIRRDGSLPTMAKTKWASSASPIQYSTNPARVAASISITGPSFRLSGEWSEGAIRSTLQMQRDN